MTDDKKKSELRELSREISKQAMKDFEKVRGYGLGRGIEDFLTARQHGWDRAGGTSGIGTADRMP